MSELPAGWTLCSLKDIATAQSGIGFPEKYQGINDEKYPVYKVGDISRAYLNANGILALAANYVSDEVAAELKGKSFPIGSTVFAKIGEALKLNRRAYVIKEGLADNNVMGVIPDLSDSNKYIYRFLQSFNIAALSRSTTVPSIRKSDLEEIEILLPPLNEQIRIADKLDSVLAKIDAAQARLEKIPTLLKRFRQSVLAAATSGELTREWRETNVMRLDQWSWKKLSDIAEIQGGVTKDSKKQSDEDEEIPYLRVANVQRGYLDLTEIKTIRIPSLKLEKLLLKQGDVLFNEGGDLDKLGRGWVWENQISRCSFQNHVFRARLYDSNNSSKYISWWGNTQGHEYFIRQGKQTTNLASINKTILSNLPINMPPAEEQKEIVRRVESLFALADAVEKQYLAAKQRLDRLTQSLLAKAFRGELVPQDPNDEPAAELLKRIQAERHAQPPTKRNRKQPG
jgi:type I restriction enzyme S subunit